MDRSESRPRLLHVAFGVVVGAAVAAVVELQRHTYALALRTVRDAHDGCSVALGAALSFAVLLAVLASWRGARGWLLLAPPAFAVTAAVAAGHLEAMAQAARATTALTMGQRAAVLALGLVNEAAFDALGMLVASGLLAWTALVVASRARVKPPPRAPLPRLFALLAGSLALAVLTAALHSWHRTMGWIGASPAAVGVVTVFVGAQALWSEDPRERGAASSGVVDAVLLAAGAVLCTAFARGFEAGVGLGDDGPMPVQWGGVVALMHGRFLMETAAGSWFVVPPVVAAACVIPRLDRVAAASHARAAAVGAWLPVALAALAFTLLRVPAAALLALRPTLTPAGFALPVLTRGGDCRAMQEDSVVTIGVDRVRRGAVDLGPATRLDDPVACAALAAQALPGIEDVWATADERTTFARLGCLLDALGNARAAAMPPGYQPRLRYLQGLPDPSELRSSPCTVRWVARDADADTPRCPSLLLGHPYCRDGTPSTELEKTEPEKTFEVAMTEPNAFRLRIVLGGTAVLRQTIIARTLVRDAAGHSGFPELERAMELAWREIGGHTNAADRRLDFATLRPAPGTPIPEVVAALEAMREVRRDYNLEGSVASVPALDVAVALPAAPRVRATVIEITAGADVPRVEIGAMPPATEVAVGAPLALHLGAIRACAQTAARAGTKLPGAAKISFSVDIDGYAFNVWVAQLPASPTDRPGPVDWKLRECIAAAIEAMPFQPAAPSSGTLSSRAYSVPFQLGP